MIRLLARLALTLIGNAVGLIVAAALLEDMTLTAAGFITALAIFTGVMVLILPLIQKQALRNSALAGGSALIATLIALIVTAWIADGLTIQGGLTWFLATVIVWVTSLIAGLLLPLILFKNVLRERRA